MLQSAKVAVATLDPQRALGVSAFGPLRFRRVLDGVAGDWRPLVTLVRLPKLTGVDCPAAPDAPCTLTGTNLFLLDSISRDAQFTQPTHIPDGFTDQSLAIPHLSDGHVYIRLRDDPTVVNSVVLDIRTPAINPAGPTNHPPAGAAGVGGTVARPETADAAATADAPGASGSGESTRATPTASSQPSSESEHH